MDTLGDYSSDSEEETSGVPTQKHGEQEGLQQRTHPLLIVESRSGNPDCMIDWGQHYLKAKLVTRKVSKSVKSDRFQQIAAAQATKNKEGGWAEQLKQQHEFYNPHFFQSVVEHVGINDALGTSDPHAETFEVWEKNVVSAD